jgi:hypothetical protein
MHRLFNLQNNNIIYKWNQSKMIYAENYNIFIYINLNNIQINIHIIIYLLLIKTLFISII